MTTSGQRIKHLRIKNNVSQQELSDTLGYKTYTTISKWESGTSLPPGKEIIRLASIFDVSTDYLLGLDDTPSEYITDESTNSIELDYFDSSNFDYLYPHEARKKVDSIQKIKVPKHIFDDSPDHYFVAKVRTDSMNRLINNGDNIVVLDFNKVKDFHIESGDIIVIKVNGDFRIVHIRKTDSRIYLEPYSYLDGFETLVYSNEEFELVPKIGKIIYTFRHF